MEGMKHIADAVLNHPGLFSVDMRHNPCTKGRDYKKFCKLMQEVFYENIQVGIQESKKYDTRIKIDWVIPDAVGLEKNRLDDKADMKITHVERQSYFVELINEISIRTRVKWSDVLQAFFGNNIE